MIVLTWGDVDAVALPGDAGGRLSPGDVTLQGHVLALSDLDHLRANRQPVAGADTDRGRLHCGGSRQVRSGRVQVGAGQVGSGPLAAERLRPRGASSPFDLIPSMQRFMLMLPGLMLKSHIQGARCPPPPVPPPMVGPGQGQRRGGAGRIG